MQIKDSGEASNRPRVLTDYCVSHGASDISICAARRFTAISIFPQYPDLQRQGIGFTLFQTLSSHLFTPPLGEEMINFHQLPF